MNKTTRNQYIRIAKDLCYSEEVIEELKKAKSEIECLMILQRARTKLK